MLFRTVRNGLVVALVALTSACATHITKPSAAPQPAAQRLATYQKVQIKDVALSPAFAESGANKKARNKIDQILTERLAMALPGAAKISAAETFPATKGRTLQIEPVIKEIKFISGAVRFWVGAMAGSSAVLMQVTYRDAETGQVLAQPEFYRQANAFSGPLGIADNRMLDEIAQDVVNYSVSNR